MVPPAPLGGRAPPHEIPRPNFKDNAEILCRVDEAHQEKPGTAKKSEIEYREGAGTYPQSWVVHWKQRIRAIFSIVFAWVETALVATSYSLHVTVTPPLQLPQNIF